MLHRRVCVPKRLMALTAATAICLIVFLRIRPKFLPDDVVDSQLRNFIKVTYQLPEQTGGPVKMATVRRIHFMQKTQLILPDYRPFVSSWRRVYPNYDIYFWTDADLDRLVASRYPELLQFYRNKLSNSLERSDFTRILILHSFGGWYSDLDAGCRNSAENLTDAHSLIVPLETNLHAMVSFNRRKLVNNAIMYSSTGHPYWRYYLHAIVKAVETAPQPVRDKDAAVFTTGPVTMTRAMHQFLVSHGDRCGGSGGGGGDYWCPYIPGPVLFSPLIDSSSAWMPLWASIMCYTVYSEPEITTECQRFRATGFANQLPSNAFTYHAFLHLTGERKSATRVNVSDWGLNIRLSPLDHLA